MRGVKEKSKKRKPIKPDNPAQSARFMYAANELGIVSAKGFDPAIKTVLKPKPKKP